MIVFFLLKTFEQHEPGHAAANHHLDHNVPLGRERERDTLVRRVRCQPPHPQSADVQRREFIRKSHILTISQN
jgi:hypothetical protein